MITVEVAFFLKTFLHPYHNRFLENTSKEVHLKSMHKKKENLIQNKLGRENGLVKLRLIIALLSVINEPHLIIYLNKYFHKNYLH